MTVMCAHRGGGYGCDNPATVRYAGSDWCRLHNPALQGDPPLIAHEVFRWIGSIEDEELLVLLAAQCRRNIGVIRDRERATMTTPPKLPDPFVFACTACAWTGPLSEIVHDAGGWGHCPQCRRLGMWNPVRTQPLSKVEPKGEP